MLAQAKLVKALAMFLILLPVADSSGQKRRHPEAQTADDQEVLSLIGALGSKTDQAAKSALSDMGPRAAPYLIRELERVADQLVTPHVGPGMEGRETSDYDPVRIESTRRYHLNWQRIDECVDLLIPMRSPDAVPALLKVMEKRRTLDAIPRNTPEHMALVQIGSSAVPQLLQELENVEVLANPHVVNAWQLRAAVSWILAEIGDPQAIPVIERLIAEGVCPADGWEARALQELRAKQSR